MGRARRAESFRFAFEPLERRDNPSAIGPPLANAQPSVIMPRTDFHKPLIMTLSIREANATQAAARVSQAFQLFEQNALGIQVKLSGLPQSGTGTGVPESPKFRQLDSGPSVPSLTAPAGTVPFPDTYETLFLQLATFTNSALTTYVARTNRQYPSIKAAPNYSPRADAILVPFADQQIARAEQQFLANPPVFDPTTGKLQDQAPKQAVEAAFNSIMYALGEYTVHPNLFTQPSDFYVDPSFTFKIPFTSDPAGSIPNVFGRGPGGVVLPGGQGR
jgi:hypothetical protein